jgi:hypothetical protein
MNVQRMVERFRSEYPTKLQFDYELDRITTREPFLVSAIFHDDRFTYIKCAAPEKPAIYEMKDGKPNLIWRLQTLIRDCREAHSE